jgi:hypothetical protein
MIVVEIIIFSLQRKTYAYNSPPNTFIDVINFFLKEQLPCNWIHEI